jgi:hypothetical protein
MFLLKYIAFLATSKNKRSEMEKKGRVDAKIIEINAKKRRR